MFGVRKLCLRLEAKLLDSKTYLSQYVLIRNLMFETAVFVKKDKIIPRYIPEPYSYHT
jgi:hypothetical protein